jgi:putative ABC transport system permease protein
MLILLLDGMWEGIRRQATVYTDRTSADLYVLQPGVRDLTAGASTLPIATLDTVRSDSAVAWAAPVRTAYVILQLHGAKVAVYVVGSLPGQPGGAWSLASGRAPTADDEVVVANVLARTHSLHIGDHLDMAGRTLRVVGLSNSTGFMIGYLFVTHTALDALMDSPTMTSFIAVGTSAPADVARRLQAQGLNVLTRDQVAANNLKVATGIFGSPIRLMLGIGFAAGTLIIALTAYTAIIERQREYGIVKAMGGARSRLVRLALMQTMTLAAVGLVAGGVLFIVGRALIDATRPQFTVLLTAGSVGRAAVAAVAMALLAAAIPARRLAALEPAVAYRSPT